MTAPTRREIAALLTLAAPPVAPATASTPSPDAELIALCAECLALEAAWEAMDAPWRATVEVPPPQIEAAIEANVTRQWEVVERIHTLPARTPEGLRAKAEAAWPGLCTKANGGPPMGDRLVWSIVRDLTGGGA
jgi:hypothetical protein